MKKYMYTCFLVLTCLVMLLLTSCGNEPEQCDTDNMKIAITGIIHFLKITRVISRPP